MSGPRYWKISNIVSDPSTWVISELQLHDSVGRIDMSATLTSTSAPTTGDLTSLYDGLTTSEVTWSYAAYTAVGFALTWDFGVSGGRPTSLKIGSGSVKEQRARSFTLSWSDDGSVWNHAVNCINAWFGSFTLSSLLTNLPFGYQTETFNVDPVGKTMPLMGAAVIAWDVGNNALSVSGNTQQNFVRLPGMGKLKTGVDSWVEMDVKLVSDSGTQRHAGMFLSTGNVFEGYRLFGINDSMGVSMWSSTGVESGYTTQSLGNAFTVGSIVTMRVERSSTGVFVIKSNGVTLFTSSPLLAFADVYPGFFVYGCSILVYDVRCAAGATLRVNGGTANLFLDSYYSKISPTAIVTEPSINTQHQSVVAMPLPSGAFAAANNNKMADLSVSEPGTFEPTVYLMDIPLSFPGYDSASGLTAVQTSTITRSMPYWAVDHRGYFQNSTLGASLAQTPNTPTVGIPVNGSISGRTKVLGVVAGNKKVRLYYRPTGKEIAEQYSDPITGIYTFTGLEPGVNKYFVAAFDNDNADAITCDAMIHDAIKPI